jgi:peptide/nickel transport system permease protein
MTSRALAFDEELDRLAGSRRQNPWFGLAQRTVSTPKGAVGAIVIVALVMLALLAPWLTWHGPNTQDASGRLLAPSWDHPFGTDELRRDLYSRTVYGLRSSLAVSVLSVALAFVLGASIGFVSGYKGGWIESVGMRIVDAWLAFPGLLAAMAVITILGVGWRNMALAIAVLSVPTFARLSRAEMIAQREQDYVLAARATGVAPVRLVLIHIVPNCIPPLITHAALAVGFAITIAAALSFLGLGEAPPAASLGGLLNTAKGYLGTAWWYAVGPGAVLGALLLALNLFSDAVNESLSRP